MEFIIEYAVKPDKEQEAEALRSAFFAALKEQPDPEISYRSLARPDGVSFVHLGWFADQDALRRFQSTPHFKEFSSGLPGVCDDGPNASPLSEIHST